MPQVTVDVLQRIAPNADSATAAALQVACDKFDIHTINRMASFLAHVCQQSDGFSFVEENMNYTAKALRSTYAKYFPTDEIAAEYGRKPKKIANLVYANRMGNGDEESGDGSKYIGRGYFSITGYNNYKEFSDSVGIPIDDVAAYMKTPEGAAVSAAWMWNKFSLNELADYEDTLNLTKKLCGNIIDLQERIDKYLTLKGALQTQI